MAEPTAFDHDQLGHLLADHLLQVPRFQRNFSWDSGNVEEYLSDLEQARRGNLDYFMGTVVFARPAEPDGRRQIVDGQQRLATTAVLLLAIRDRLHQLGKSRQAGEIEKRYLRGYDISADAEVERLILSPNDQTAYDALLTGRIDDVDAGNPLRNTYQLCRDYLIRIAPAIKDFTALIDISRQLENKVQVLVAVARDLPEAYVIFETLNDRGADLTTADLLKNYLFSASKSYFSFVEAHWTLLESRFDRPEDLVKFIRYEYVSRAGPISSRKLYRAIQGELQGRAPAVRHYIAQLVNAMDVYLALKEPESPYWETIDVDVSDGLYAYRRFGFEASIPVLLAAFANWPKAKAAKLLAKMSQWSIRAQVVGNLGGGVAEESFGDTARSISDGTIANQTKVRESIARLIPTDADFRTAFVAQGDTQVARAKYFLAMLEKAENNLQGRADVPIEWHSRSVTIEHIERSSSSDAELTGLLNRLGNLTLLEKKLNRKAGGKSFADKRGVYKESQFEITKKLSRKQTWTKQSVAKRTEELADLAIRAWPLH